MIAGHKTSCSERTGSWGDKNRQQNTNGCPATHLKDHPRLLQQVGPHVGPDDVVLFIKANLNELPKAAAIVVASGLGIPNGLD